MIVDSMWIVLKYSESALSLSACVSVSLCVCLSLPVSLFHRLDFLETTIPLCFIRATTSVAIWEKDWSVIAVEWQDPTSTTSKLIVHSRENERERGQDWPCLDRDSSDRVAKAAWARLDAWSRIDRTRWSALADLEMTKPNDFNCDTTALAIWVSCWLVKAMHQNVPNRMETLISQLGWPRLKREPRFGKRQVKIIMKTDWH